MLPLPTVHGHLLRCAATHGSGAHASQHPRGAWSEGGRARVQVDTERSERWQQVLRATVAAAQDSLAQHPTGLFPDFVEHDAAAGRHRAVAGKVLEREHDDSFCWNACRSAAWLAAWLASRFDAQHTLLQGPFQGATCVCGDAGPHERYGSLPQGALASSSILQGDRGRAREARIAGACGVLPATAGGGCTAQHVSLYCFPAAPR